MERCLKFGLALCSKTQVRRKMLAWNRRHEVVRVRKFFAQSVTIPFADSVLAFNLGGGHFDSRFASKRAPSRRLQPLNINLVILSCACFIHFFGINGSPVSDRKFGSVVFRPSFLLFSTNHLKLSPSGFGATEVRG